MKPVPHPHSCPACACIWECYNPHCEDLEAHWCRNLCKVCDEPPAYIKQARALLDAAEEMHHAAYVVEHHGGDVEMAEDIRMVRKRLQWKAGHITRPKAPSPVSEVRDPSESSDS